MNEIYSASYHMHNYTISIDIYTRARMLMLSIVRARRPTNYRRRRMELRTCMYCRAREALIFSRTSNYKTFLTLRVVGSRAFTHEHMCVRRRYSTLSLPRALHFFAPAARCN